MSADEPGEVPPYDTAAQADADIYEIGTYLARHNRPAAEQLLARLSSAFDLLARNPYAGMARPELRPGLRSFVVGSYIIFYEPTREGNIIVRVLHGARNVTPSFFGTDPLDLSD